MLNTPWETGSALYRKLLLSALITTAIGIIAAVAGAMLSSDTLLYVAMPVIIIGLAIHIVGLVVRGRDAKRRHQGHKNP